jgi:DNA-binding transcriptional regulator GbsR (MarR family)
LMEVFEQNFKDILTNSSEIRDIMTHNLSWLEHFFSENFDRTIDDAKKAIKSAEKGLNNLWDKAWELHNKAQDAVKWALNDLFQF